MFDLGGSQMATGPLKNRVAVITGSAGGLGSALAIALRDKGVRVALLDQNLADVKAQAACLGGDGIVHAYQADVRSLDSITQAIDSAAAHFGRIDIVVANAGIGKTGSLEHIDPSDYEAVIDVNLNGVWRTLRAAVPHVTATRGYLMAISSMAAFVHLPMGASYSASKAGVWALCDAVRLELRPDRVGVGTVYPTFFRTPLVEATLSNAAAVHMLGGSEEAEKQLVDKDEVIREIVRGIEQRSDIVVVPKRLGGIARAPGLFRKVAEKYLSNDDRLVTAKKLALQEEQRHG
jgi:NAD(P)-dependent dehydrogenase (short-subunit alcohol dehydrogenase family)